MKNLRKEIRFMNDILYSVEEIRYNEGGCNSTGYSANVIFENEDDAIVYVEDQFRQLVKDAKKFYADIADENKKQRVIQQFIKQNGNYAIGKWLKFGNHFKEIEMRFVYSDGEYVNGAFSSDLSKFIHD